MQSWRQTLYFASPVWVQNLLANAYGLRLRYLRYGAGQREYLRQLLESEALDVEAVNRRQLAVLQRIVAQAYATIPLYRDKYRDDQTSIRVLADLRALPLLRKDELRRSRDDLVSQSFRGRRLEEIHTGGTTGKPLTVYCDRAVLQRNYAFYGRLLAWARIRASDRIAVFAGRTIVPPAQRKPPYWRSNRPGRAKLFSSYHISADTLPAYVSALERFQPALIDSYPSSLAPIARHLLEHGVTSIRPRAIVTSSETLTPHARERIERAFACPVFDYYGGAEMAAFVSQCERGRYHAHPEFGIVEILNGGAPVRRGELGEIVATGFINPVMPLIRYATGDLAEHDGEPCPCGRPFPTIARIVGRLDDVVTTPEGRLIGRLDPIFKAASTVHESRIVQDAHDHVRLEVVPNGELAAEEREALERELAARLGPSMRIDVVVVASIPRTGAGKLRTVVNLVARQS